MEKFDLYKDIQIRTGGEINIGIIGPVRTGKSTFIRKFSEIFILPGLTGTELEQVRDSLPASASGKTVTTVEPKFIPRESVPIKIEDGSTMKIRLVDCVGYLVNDAEGVEEEGKARMVHTPWNAKPIPFREAAQIGTDRVIRDHATLGIVITADGTFGDIRRSAYRDAEKEAIEKMQSIGKPFLVVVNSAAPDGYDAKETVKEIQKTYGTTTLSMNCMEMGMSELHHLMEQFLFEFPLTRVLFHVPRWTETLESDHWLKQELFTYVKNHMIKLHMVKDLYAKSAEEESTDVKKIKMEQVDLSTGIAELTLELRDNLYYDILTELTGTQIQSEYQLIAMIREMTRTREACEAVATALEAVNQTGYGVIPPARGMIHTQEPEIMKQGNRYGVRMKAEAQSIHLIQAPVEAEITPVVGSEEQAKELIEYIKENGDALIFGKSADEMIADGLNKKLENVNEKCQHKLQYAMARIINESNGKIICIII